MKDSRKYRICYIIAAGLIPLLVFLVVFSVPYITQGINTVLTSDLYGQYINYLVYFRNAILNHEDITYSFSSVLGGETMALVGYYILSPFNLLFLVFPAEDASRVVFYIIALKVFSAGITGGLFFGRKTNYDISSLIFSSSYALSGYIFAYFMHIMWLDSVYMLPLVALGLEKLIRDRKSLLYILALTYTFVANYYTGYMVAIFCVIYFFYLLITDKYGIREIYHSTWRFFFSSLCSGMLFAVVLIPTAISQLGNREALPQDEIVYTVAQYFSKLFTASLSFSEFNAGAPNVYCGVFILQLVILSIISFGKKLSLRKKICQLLFIGVFILSFSVEKLDLVWHLLSAPHNFHFRYSFIFIFVALIVAQDFFENKQYKIKLLQIMIADAICVAMLVFVQKNHVSSVSDIGLNADLILIMLFSNLILFRNRINLKAKRIKRAQIYDIVLSAVILVIQCGILCYNASSYMTIHSFDEGTEKIYYSNVSEYVDLVKQQDDGLYRLEKTFLNTTNDSWLFAYNGLTSFSSSEKSSTRNFNADIGYNKSYYWGSYDHGAALSGDSLLGVKYIISNNDDYAVALEQSDYYVYKNPYALELGLISDYSINQVEIETEKPFDNQNEIYSGIVGHEVKIFETVDDFVLSSSENVVCTETDGCNYMFINSDGSKDGIINIHFTARNQDKHYLFISSVYEPTVRLSVNGVDKGLYLSTYHQGMLEIGEFEIGEEVEISMTMSLVHCGFSDVQIASFNENVFKTVYDELKDKNWTVKEHDKNYVKAEVNVSDNGILLMTIPYNEGWKLTVDGENVEIQTVLDIFMGANLEKGTHEIELKYEVVGLKYGLIITAAGIVLLILIILKEHKEEERIW